MATPCGVAAGCGAVRRDRAKLRVYELHDRAKPVDAALGYVRIEIGDVDRKVDLRRLPGRLAEVYRPLLDGGPGADGESGAGGRGSLGAG